MARFGLLWVLLCLPLAALGDEATCVDCHRKQAADFDVSVHRNALHCQDCHGGEYEYALTAEQRAAYGIAEAGPKGLATRPALYHGPTFRGKPSRAQTPDWCGSCHADIERMNRYGLRTDQLSGYWTSGHGKRLKQSGDDRVAVCTDCHGAHDILPSSNAHSRTFFANVPATCSRCHSDPALMSAYNLSAAIGDQYAKSIHGRNVLEKNDTGSPNCATCHGSHAAAPPGFADVRHVCGRCHQQVEQYLESGVHGKVPGISRCTGCHGGEGNPKNHQIGQATPTAERVVGEFTSLREQFGGDERQLKAKFVEQIEGSGDGLRVDAICARCHTGSRPDPHAQFFVKNDERARQFGREIGGILAEAQWEYARIAERAARDARGVLLVRDEQLRVADVKTELLALYAFLHTVNVDQVRARAGKISELCKDIGAALEEKESALSRRKLTVAAVWIAIAVFCVLMYGKYKQLRRAYVRKPGEPAAALALPVVVPRRHFLDATLRVLGSLGAAALLWPAIAYILPARKRGGAGERVSLGKETDWPIWDVRKTSVAGKPVAVVRTDKGFKALSLVCTHLGCIVFWEQSKREFHCPCHAASFAADGKVLGGPPPRPLPEYAVSVIQGEVIVAGAATA